MHTDSAPLRGVTLVELLVSTLIVGLGLVAVSQLYLAATWTYDKARNLSVATERAQFELEKVRNLGFYPLENGPTESGYLPIARGGDYTYLPQDNGKRGVRFSCDPLPQGTGTVTWTHYPVDTPGNSQQLKVTIDITWRGRRPTPERVTIYTLLTNR